MRLRISAQTAVRNWCTELCRHVLSLEMKRFHETDLAQSGARFPRTRLDRNIKTRPKQRGNTSLHPYNLYYFIVNLISDSIVLYRLYNDLYRLTRVDVRERIEARQESRRKECET